MIIVDKKEASNRRTVSTTEREAFRLVYGWREVADDVTKRTAQEVFREGLAGAHIECDCLRGGVPLIICRKDGKVQRHPESPHHHSYCAFHRTPEEVAQHRRSYSRPSPNREYTFIFDPEAPKERLDEAADEERDLREVTHGGSARRPALATLLFGLLDTVGWNKVASDDDRRWPDLEGLKRGAQDFTVARGVKLHLAMTCDTRGLVALPRRLPGLNWPPRVPPQGFFICIADEIRPGVLDLKRFGVEVPVQCPIATFGENGRIWGRQPYLFIGVFSVPAGGRVPVAVNAAANDVAQSPIFQFAYAHPVLSLRRWMPVDSKMERRSYDAIENALLYAQQQNLIENWTIEKPLFDISSLRDHGERVLCRPDFIVHLSWGEEATRRLVVETMGSADDSYQEAKSVTHPRMEEIGEVICHNTFELDEGCEDKRFNSKLLAAIHRIRR